MYNPFPLFNGQLLKDKIAEGKRYFVRQTYPRGLMAETRASFLIRAYDEHEKQQAEKHIEFLSNDSFRYLYDAREPIHLEKLKMAAGQPLGFKIYYAGKKGLDWIPPASYKEKMKRYIGKKHPNWRAQRTDKKVRIGLYEEFGKLFLKFSFGEEEDKVPLDEVEKY
jgi:hypothetical protein